MGIRNGSVFLSDNNNMSADLLNEINQVASFKSDMPHVAYYIAGCARQYTNLSPVVLLQFLDKFYSKVSRQGMTIADEREIESKIYKGDLGSAQEMMRHLEKDYEQRTEKLFREIEQSVLVKLENEKYICSLCKYSGDKEFMIKLDNCGHIYHSECYDIYSYEGDTKCIVEGCRNTLNKAPVRYEVFDEEQCSQCGALYPNGTHCHKCDMSSRASDLVLCPKCTFANGHSFQRVITCVCCSTKFCSECKNILLACRCSSIIVKK